MDRFGLTSGTEFGGYRIVDTLGAGGMGTVYHAVDADGHHVALKLLHPMAAADPDARARLRREVSALQRIRHPQVARVLDAETDSAEAFIVTELIPGISLGQRIRRSGRIPSDELADLAESLTSTLHAVHAAGVLHRDLKPGNVMLGPHGPVLIDFGIAHDGSEAKVTATGMIVGTPGYIPPESVAGERPSKAGDWWSLAAVLAYAATGRPPYGSGSWEVVLARLVGGEPDLSGLEPAVAKALGPALDPVPAHRPAPDQLVRDLRAASLAGGTDTSAADDDADANATAAVPFSPTAMIASNTPTEVVAPAGSADPTEFIEAESPTGLLSSNTPTEFVAGPNWAAETPTKVAPAGLPPFEGPQTPPMGEPMPGPAVQQLPPANPQAYRPPLVQPYLPPNLPAYPTQGAEQPGQFGPQGYDQQLQNYPLAAPPGPVYPWHEVRHRPGTLLALAAVLGFAATMWPYPCAGIALAYLIVARTVAGAAAANQTRRYRKGTVDGSGWRTALGVPWYVVRGIVGLLPALILALAISMASGWLIASFVSLPVAGTDLDLSVVVSVLVPIWLALLTCWWGPNSQATRRGGRLTVNAVIPPRLSVVVVVVALACCCAIIFGWWTVGAPPGISWPTFHVG